MKYNVKGKECGKESFRTEKMLKTKISVKWPGFAVSLSKRELSSKGHEGSVSCCESVEKAIVEVPYEIHDVVSETRRA